ncbi:MAG: hypothetical protein IIA88_01155 [Bacteroidetes bacterium]|nr:hypothetical protein [Bacteroidota bacterium]
MTIERTKDEILIRLQSTMGFKKIEAWIEYFNVMDILSKSKGTEKEALKLAKEVNTKWWVKNKSRFL